VLHYLVDEKSITPNRVSAIGYGEYRPVASNDTKDGRQLNRRVEIVILPQVTKVK
jgi:chemotaxis protein MotB